MLPTHVALVNQRLNISGKDSSAEAFLFISYLAEVTIKTIATSLHGGLSLGSPEDGYRMAHVLIKAEGNRKSFLNLSLMSVIIGMSAGPLPDKYCDRHVRSALS